MQAILDAARRALAPTEDAESDKAADTSTLRLKTVSLEERRQALVNLSVAQAKKELQIARKFNGANLLRKIRRRAQVIFDRRIRKGELSA